MTIDIIILFVLFVINHIIQNKQMQADEGSGLHLSNFQQRPAKQSSEQQQQQDQLQVQTQDSLSTLVLNIKLYNSVLTIEEPVPNEILQIYKPIIINQISQFQNVNNNDQLEQVHILPLTQLIHKYGIKINQLDGNAIQNLDQFNRVMHELYAIRMEKQFGQTEIKTDRSNKKRKKVQIEKISFIIQSLWQQMLDIIEEDSFTTERLQNYQVYQNNTSNQLNSDLYPYGQTHFAEQTINCNIEYPVEVFSFVQPPLHQQYVRECSKVYDSVVPFRIKFIIQKSQEPKINCENYFSQKVQMQKAAIYYPIPNSKTLKAYLMADICTEMTFQKEYLRQIVFPMKWSFSSFSNLVTTSEGQIFGVNCRTTKQKIDPSMYYFTQEKVINCGRIIQAKRQSSILYLNGSIYIIGGKGPHEKCSRKMFRYRIKQKKWEELSESNFALRKPTVCVFGKFILKMGGVNQFDYINKGIQMYDPQNNAWGIVRANPKSVIQEIEVLEDSIAVKINDDEVYVFGGRNNNRFSSDSGYVLRMTEIRQRNKKSPKVSAQLWNVSISNRNIYSFSGVYSQSNVIVYGNCIYVLRTQQSLALAPQL